MGLLAFPNLGDPEDIGVGEIVGDHQARLFHLIEVGAADTGEVAQAIQAFNGLVFPVFSYGHNGLRSPVLIKIPIVHAHG